MAYNSRYLRITDPLMEGIDVTNVQERLTDLGYYEGPISGVYDRDTAEAVRNFQEGFGLVADGVLGPDTWNSIGISPDALELFDNQYQITVDLGQRELTLREGQQILRGYPVAVGKPATPTPTGNWRIIQKTENPGGPFGARWMRLSIPWGGYGIHGTNNPESIGSAVSNGCIRMFNEDVIELYDIVPLGTEVIIVGSNDTGRLLFLGVEPGPDILRVQEMLQRIGYYTGPLDSTYSEVLRDSVIAFQRDYGLLPDGVVGTETLTNIEKMNDIVLGNTEP